MGEQINIKAIFDGSPVASGVRWVKNSVGELRNDLKKKAEATGIFASLKEQIASVAKGATGLGGILSGLAKGASLGFVGAIFGAVSAAVGAIGNLVSSGIQSIVALSKESRAIGVGVEPLQQLEKAGRAYNMQMEDVEASLGRVRVSQAQASSSSEALAASFANLGITQKELRSLSPDQMFLRLAKAYDGAKDKAAAFAEITEIVGKRNVKALGLVTSGAENIQKAMSAASVITAKAAAEYSTWGKSSGGAMKEVGIELLNVVAGILRVIRLSMVLQTVWEAVKVTAGTMVASVSGIFSSLATFSTKPLKEAWSGIKSLFSNASQNIDRGMRDSIDEWRGLKKSSTGPADPVEDGGTASVEKQIEMRKKYADAWREYHEARRLREGADLPEDKKALAIEREYFALVSKRKDIEEELKKPDLSLLEKNRLENERYGIVKRAAEADKEAWAARQAAIRGTIDYMRQAQAAVEAYDSAARKRAANALEAAIAIQARHDSAATEDENRRAEEMRQRLDEQRVVTGYNAAGALLRNLTAREKNAALENEGLSQRQISARAQARADELDDEKFRFERERKLDELVLAMGKIRESGLTAPEKETRKIHAEDIYGELSSKYGVTLGAKELENLAATRKPAAMDAENPVSKIFADVQREVEGAAKSPMAALESWQKAQGEMLAKQNAVWDGLGDVAMRLNNVLKGAEVEIGQ